MGMYESKKDNALILTFSHEITLEKNKEWKFQPQLSNYYSDYVLAGFGVTCEGSADAFLTGTTNVVLNQPLIQPPSILIYLVQSTYDLPTEERTVRISCILNRRS